MDKNEKKTVKNPRLHANPLSVISFTWLFNTFRLGNRRELEVGDLYSPLPEHTSRHLGDEISRLWDEEVEKCNKQNERRQPSLLRVLVKQFGKSLLVVGLFEGILEFFIRATQPLVLAKLLQYFSGETGMSKTEAYLWGAGIVVGSVLDGLIYHPCAQGVSHIGMKMRVACCSLIYRKSLKVSKASIEDNSSAGQMINLLSNDVNRIDYATFFMHYIWIAPLQAAVISYYMYKQVGIAIIGGVVTFLLFIPLHALFGKVASKYTYKYSHRTDERLRLTNEIISGVQVIKMYAWEKPFSEILDAARQKEVNIIKKNAMTTEISLSFESYIPRVCLFVTLLAYVFLDNNIDADKVYLITGLYNVIRTNLYRAFPMGIREFAEGLVAVRRIEKFLKYDEVRTNKSTIKSAEINEQSAPGVAIEFKDVTAKWSPEGKEVTLNNINLKINSGSLVAIIGRVGSSKTSLLHALINEITSIKGDLKIHGKISYASQEAWIFASSIRQNILFGQPMKKERYNKVIEICQLKRDFNMFSHGDQTLVGERGINLSGGQRARINLARAIYYEADIYLLDDPLSAVDTHVGKHIFEECIVKFLNDKTVVLVTHQLQYMKSVDDIVVMNAGSIQAQGTYGQLQNSGLDLVKVMEAANDPESKPDSRRSSIKSTSDLNLNRSVTDHSNPEENEESRTLGSISAKTYLSYFKAVGSNVLVLTVLVVTIGVQVVSSGGDYLVALWVNEEETYGPRVNETTYKVSADQLKQRYVFIYVYGGMIVATILLTLAQTWSFFEMTMRVSRQLHGSMFSSIVRAPMSFFNNNPLGRVMNRFSKDMGIIDTRMPLTILDISQIGVYAIAVIVIVTSVNQYLLIPAVGLSILFYFLRRFYITTSRGIKRLEGITRSPVFNHISATLQGLPTIRSVNAQDILAKEFDSHQDLHSSSWFIFFSGHRAFGMYLELSCALFVGFVTFTLLFLPNAAGNVGLAITQCILLTGMLQWGIRQTAELENQMTSVERVLEYSNLRPEPPLESKPENKPSKDWPKYGLVEFRNVFLKYDSDTVTLKNVNFVIAPNEKVGIVGRTGAGKSSLINALFRLADIEGEIYIDEIPTSSLGLHDLRSKISIIPQEPVLFAGSLRKNLDPFEEHTDSDLWRALEEVEMKKFMDSDLGLNLRVSEGGTNFSVGQRQLLCLARAIVRDNRILVLDEATANVDPHTDELIQQTVRTKFKNCTVLTVAHRLNTVMDSNRILVMDKGCVVEFDHPYVLLHQGHGFLFDIVQQAGPAMAAILMQMAKSNYESIMPAPHADSIELLN